VKRATAFARYAGLVIVTHCAAGGLHPRLYAFACVAGSNISFSDLLLQEMCMRIVRLFVTVLMAALVLSQVIAPRVASLAKSLKASRAAITVEQEPYQRAADYSAEYRGLSLLVMKDGKVVFEQYQNGH